MYTDPIVKTEKIVRDLHDEVGKRTSHTLSKYPLLFLFLIVFGVAVILQGFELFIGNVPLFKQKPLLLIIIGVFILFVTGQLYKTLERMK
jgi:hypothetical protein